MKTFQHVIRFLRRRPCFSLLALGLLLLLPGQTQAATFTYSPGDLIVGFYSPTAANEYVINLGAFSPGTKGTFGADLSLSSAFGANWKTRSDLYWGVFGTSYDPNIGPDPSSAVLYVAAPTGAAPLVQSDWITQLWPGMAINDMANSDGINGKILTASGGVKHSASDPDSFTSYQPPIVSQSFGYWDGVGGSFANGPAGAALDLYRLTPSNDDPFTDGLSELVARVTINDEGTVIFESSVSSVPDAGSTLLLLGLGILVLAMVVGRKGVKAL